MKANVANDYPNFLSHLLPPNDGGRLGWGWTAWTFFPPPESSPTMRGGSHFGGLIRVSVFQLTMQMGRSIFTFPLGGLFIFYPGTRLPKHFSEKYFSSLSSFFQGNKILPNDERQSMPSLPSHGPKRTRSSLPKPDHLGGQK